MSYKNNKKGIILLQQIVARWLIMELTSVLNLVIFGMILYIGLIVVPALMENKKTL